MNNEHKQAINEKFMELLQFEPWNQATLEKACGEAGFNPDYIDVVYPGKIEEFTKEFVQGCNSQAFLKAKENWAALKTTKKVEEIIFQRICQYHFKLKNLEGLKKFLSYSATPSHIHASLKNIYDFSSEVWYELGDRSVDISYYTKRLSLSAIYSKSMLYSLSDKSDNLHQTREFIQKSIDGLMKINKLKQKVNEIINIIPFKFRA